MGNGSAKNWIGYLALAIAIIFAAKQCGRIAGEEATEANMPSAPNSVSATGEIYTAATRQSAEGVTEGQMDSAFIERLGEWIAERNYSNAVASQAKESGVIIERPTPESVVVEAGGRRFGIIRLRSQGFAPAVTIVGIDGQEMIRVTCVSRIVQDVAVSRGPCADKIKEAFGVSISG